MLYSQLTAADASQSAVPHDDTNPYNPAFAEVNAVNQISTSWVKHILPATTGVEITDKFPYHPGRSVIASLIVVILRSNFIK